MTNTTHIQQTPTHHHKTHPLQPVSSQRTRSCVRNFRDLSPAKQHPTQLHQKLQPYQFRCQHNQHKCHLHHLEQKYNFTPEQTVPQWHWFQTNKQTHMPNEHPNPQHQHQQQLHQHLTIHHRQINSSLHHHKRHQHQHPHHRSYRQANHKLNHHRSFKHYKPKQHNTPNSQMTTLHKQLDQRSSNGKWLNKYPPTSRTKKSTNATSTSSKVGKEFSDTQLHHNNCGIVSKRNWHKYVKKRMYQIYHNMNTSTFQHSLQDLDQQWKNRLKECNSMCQKTKQYGFWDYEDPNHQSYQQHGPFRINSTMVQRRGASGTFFVRESSDQHWRIKDR